MAIKKQEFYEGAALRALVCEGSLSTISYQPPYFILNDSTPIYIKYSTRVRSPWAFTFTAQEHARMHKCSEGVVIALVCGSDGIAAITVVEYRSAASSRRSSAIHVSCYRRHGEYYDISGPDGSLDRKISPSRWKRLLG